MPDKQNDHEHTNARAHTERIYGAYSQAPVFARVNSFSGVSWLLAVGYSLVIAAWFLMLSPVRAASPVSGAVGGSFGCSPWRAARLW